MLETTTDTTTVALPLMNPTDWRCDGDSSPGAARNTNTSADENLSSRLFNQLLNRNIK